VLTAALQENREPTYKIVEDPAAPPAARTLRDVWLRP
jgi:hypothetical protein